MMTLKEAIEKAIYDATDALMYGAEYEAFNDNEKSTIMTMVAKQLNTYAQYYQERHARHVKQTLRELQEQRQIMSRQKLRNGLDPQDNEYSYTIHASDNQRHGPETLHQRHGADARPETRS